MFSSGAFGPVIFGVIAINAALACIPATNAGNKGRSFGGFWLFGFFAFVIALAVALLITDESHSSGRGRLPCPRCAELIAPGARICRFCGAEFDQPIATTSPSGSSVRT